MTGLQHQWMEMMSSLPKECHLILRSMFISRALNVELGNRANRFGIMARSAYTEASDTSQATWGFEWSLFLMEWRYWITTKLINLALGIRSIFLPSNSSARISE